MRPSYNLSEVKQPLLAFFSRQVGFPHIVSDFEQNFIEQQVSKSNFRSKLLRFAIKLYLNQSTTKMHNRFVRYSMTYDNDLPHLSCLATGQILKLSQRMDLYVQLRRRSWGVSPGNSL